MATWLQYRAIGFSLEQRLREQDTISEINAPHFEEKSFGGRTVLIVGWDGREDPMNPQNWSTSKRWTATSLVSILALLVGVCASIESPVRNLAAKDLAVSEVVESLSVALFLVGFGFGSMVSGPASEVLGRSGTYLVTLLSLCVWLMAATLAPEIISQCVFRFLAGFSGASPLVCSGGTISDLWSPLERTYTFPFFAIVGFGTPSLGPVISAWIPDSPHLHTWRWAPGIATVFSGVTLLILLMFQPETLSSQLLSWKARHLRRITGDQRYCALHEIQQTTVLRRLSVAILRPFSMAATEVTIQLISLYLSVIYIILFTFFDGYPDILGEPYNLSTGLTFTALLGITVGACLVVALLPFVYNKTLHVMSLPMTNASSAFDPRVRLWFAMLTAPLLPLSLFMMAWTAIPSISIWVPLAASVLFGLSTTALFTSFSMYLIDRYTAYAASAMAFTYLARYCSAGVMTVVGIPMYARLGAHWTLTLLGIISVVLTPIPYVLYRRRNA